MGATEVSGPADVQRQDAFVDAAFAFAVSLLIIAGAEPLRSYQDLQTALARIPAFAASFALIALFWIAHRSWSRLGARRDGWSTLLSLSIVFAVLVFVFPLRLLTESATHFLSGGRLPGGGLMSALADLRGTYVTYGAAFGALAALYALLFAHAARSFAAASEGRRQAASWAWSWGVALAGAAVSCGLALSPALRSAPWAPGVAYNLIPLAIGLLAWKARQPAPDVKARPKRGRRGSRASRRT